MLQRIARFLWRAQVMLSSLCRIVGDRRGVTAIEYALIVFLIGTGAVAAMTTLGHTLFNLAGPIGSALN